MTAADVKPVANIRTVGSQDVSELAAITADAFRHDPFVNWMLKSQKHKLQMYTILAKHVYAPRGFCQIYEEDGVGQAATMWMMPGGNTKESFLGSLSLMKTFAMDDGISGMKRGFFTGQAMEKQHPKEPHVYLFTVGVRGAARGRGLGRQMIEPVLAACDESGMMAYLENSNPANERVYNSLGFEHDAMIEPMAGSVTLQAMKRKPSK